MNYSQIKKLDEESLQRLKEGPGPADECICNLLAPPDGASRKGVRASIRKALASIGGQKNRGPPPAGGGGAKGGGGGFGGGGGGHRGGGGRGGGGGVVRLPGAAGQNSVEIPVTFTQGGKGIHSTKEAVKRKTSCGKCGCDNEKVVLKHSYANIRITSPDVSSICPCPTDCLPGKEKLTNNIKVTIEQLTVQDGCAADSRSSICDAEDNTYTRGAEVAGRPAQDLVEDFWTAEESDGD